jgi:replication factor C subunit 2/4
VRTRLTLLQTPNAALADGARRIIEPLASRCSKFRFKPLDVRATTARLEHIALAERVPAPPAALDALIRASAGDLRRAITYLQSVARLHAATVANGEGADGASTEITALDVQEIAGVVPDGVVRSFARACGVDAQGVGDGDDDEMDVDAGGGAPRRPGFDSIRAKVKELMLEGFAAAQLISQVRFYHVFLFVGRGCAVDGYTAARPRRAAPDADSASEGAVRARDG